IHVVLPRVLLEACARAVDASAGLAAADRTLATAGAVRVFEAEVRRLRAEFLATLHGSPDEITAELERARAISHQQGAVAFVLRTGNTLLRYQREYGDDVPIRDARRQLASTVAARPHWDDSPDVREAAILLAD